MYFEEHGREVHNGGGNDLFARAFYEIDNFSYQDLRRFSIKVMDPGAMQRGAIGEEEFSKHVERYIREDVKRWCNSVMWDSNARPVVRKILSEMGRDRKKYREKDK